MAYEAKTEFEEIYVFESNTELTNFIRRNDGVKQLDHMIAVERSGGNKATEWLGLDESQIPEEEDKGYDDGYGDDEDVKTSIQSITWEQLKTLSQQSWGYGLEVFESYYEKLKAIKIPELKSRKRKTEFSTEGDDIDLDRMREGDPKFFRETKREQSTGSTELTIFIDTSTAYFMQSEDILWRGASALALAYLLEEKGYTCEIWVVNGTHLYSDHPKKRVYTACKLKNCGDPFDKSSMINAVSGWFYRGITLSLLLTLCHKNSEEPAYGLGSVATPKQKTLDLLSNDMNRVYVSEVFTFSAAARLIEDEITRLAEQQSK